MEHLPSKYKILVNTRQREGIGEKEEKNRKEEKGGGRKGKDDFLLNNTMSH